MLYSSFLENIETDLKFNYKERVGNTSLIFEKGIVKIKVISYESWGVQMSMWVGKEKIMTAEKLKRSQALDLIRKALDGVKI